MLIQGGKLIGEVKRSEALGDDMKHISTWLTDLLNITFTMVTISGIFPSEPLTGLTTLSYP